MLTDSQNRSLMQTASTLSDDASGDPIARWLSGVGFAILFWVLGAYQILMQHTYFIGPGRHVKAGRIVEYTGGSAITIGIATIGIGIFLHGHYFWSSSNRYYFLSQVLKPLGLLATAGAFGYFAFDQIVFG